MEIYYLNNDNYLVTYDGMEVIVRGENNYSKLTKLLLRVKVYLKK